MKIKARLILGNGDIRDRDDLDDEYDSIEWARKALTQEMEPPIVRVTLDRDRQLSKTAGRVVYVERDRKAA